jgi:hypothetical protein
VPFYGKSWLIRGRCNFNVFADLRQKNGVIPENQRFDFLHTYINYLAIFFCKSDIFFQFILAKLLIKWGAAVAQH